MGRFPRAIFLVAALFLTACQNPAGLATASIGPVLVPMPETDRFDGSTPMAAGMATDAPSGYVAFCERQPDQCEAGNGSEPAVITLDTSTWHLLQQVNTAWNTAIKPMEDAAHYGQVDYWTIPKDGYGDCEDYALGKRMSLLERGLPRGALRLTLAQTPSGEAHTVLIAMTDHGDYVLDNLNAAVLPWQATRYQWIARQVPGRTQWASIGSTQHWAANLPGR